MNRHSLTTAFVLYVLVSVAGMQTAVAQAKPEKKPSKPLPCEGGKLLVRHAYSECAPDGFWHVVEDDYYDCPPTKKFRVWDAPTDQPCKGDKKVPAPNPIGTGYVQFNGSGCSHSELVGTMDVYECENGVWSLNTYEVFDCDDGRKLVKLKDRKLTNKPCNEPPPELDLPKITASAAGLNELRNPSGGQTCNALVAAHQIKVEILGTGETIGHVADVRVDNLTDQAISFSIPPVVLESGSGKNQDYVVPQGENIALRPHESKTVPMDGVCVNRHKPPVGKGVGNDLAINDPGGNVPRDEHSHLKRDDADKLLRIAKSKYAAADKLEDDGLLKDMPYKDKKKRKEIVEQWSMWTDPRISEIEGGLPATKDDLKKVVEKQVSKVPPDEKKKIDKGIETIWDKIQLTNEKAKDYEKPEGETVEETPPIGGPEYVGQTGHTYAKQPTPSPTPKPRGGGGKTKSKPTPTPTPTPTPNSGSGGSTTEKPGESPTATPEETQGVATAPGPNAKPKEAVVVVVASWDPAKDDILRSGDLLKDVLNNVQGKDAQKVTLGDTGCDVPELGKLEDYLKKKFGCLDSLHILGHGTVDDNNGNHHLKFPGTDASQPDTWVRPETQPSAPDVKPARNEYPTEKFAQMFQNCLCKDGEGWLETCFSAAPGDSIAQSVADKSGHTIHGHTGTVQFPPTGTPRPGPGDTPVTATPSPK